MVQVDIPIAFGLGPLFADIARRQLGAGRPAYYYRTLLTYNLFQIFCFSWIPVWFLTNYFGWETTYMWWHADSVAAYPSYIPIFMIIFFAVANLGFLLGYHLVTAGRFLANRLIYLGVLAYTAAWIFGQTDRTFRLGTYEEWQAGNASWFYEDKRFVVMLGVTILIWGVGLMVAAAALRRDGRHLDRYVTRRS